MITTVRRTSDVEIVIERTFQASPRVVFTAYTRADLVKKWFAPKSMGAEMKEVTADVRVGGRYRYVTKGPDGEFAFSGEYTEVTPFSRVAYTSVFEPMAHLGAAQITVAFHDDGGRTKLVGTERYPSKEALDGLLQSGMEHGLSEVFNQLDALSADLKL
jgi:uncharacterized protein YndB with AHSA1/START domain